MASGKMDNPSLLLGAYSLVETLAMRTPRLIQLLPLVATAIGAATAGAGGSCKCFPGDTCWPSESSWASLNDTVGGRLVATVPLGSPCHDPTYDEQVCASLRAQWLESGIHMQSSSSVMAPFFANQSCDPFQPRETPCTLGNYVRYSVNATGPEDVQAAVKFAAEKDVRLVIRNTGHDYLGRSTGAGSLAIWTHHLKDIQLVDYEEAGGEEDAFRGKAFRIGAGVQGFEVLEAATREGLVVVTGECPTVGLAGGYTQGGGHSVLSTKFGLGADNALSYDVVTAAGELVTASRSENADLYWALSGGGPGNFGVVTSMTVMAHPDKPVTGLFLQLSATDSESVYSAVDALHQTLPDIIDAGVMMVYFAGSSFFYIPALGAFDMSREKLEKEVMAPFYAKLDSLGLAFTANYTESPRYIEHYKHFWGPLPLGNVEVGVKQYGGRLIKRSQLSNATGAARAIMDQGVDFAGVALDVSKFGKRGGKSINAVHPAWRETISMAVLTLPWSFTAPWEDGLAVQRKMTEVAQPIIDAATPGSGAYMNEADFRQPDWQEAFFGDNYPKLLEIKKKWDPQGLFYGWVAVGSEAYTVRDDGRLCRNAS
ncbi:hypothetical protein PG989_011542 [Apiospora arundinis]